MSASSDAASRRRFGLRSAFDAAAAGEAELARWVGDFLASRGSGNAVLAAALAQRPHWWLGPLSVPLDDLDRLAGPEDDALCPVDEDDWQDDVDGMEESLAEGWEPPPLLAEPSGERLVLQDGNHRYEALRQRGEERAWVLVFFDDPAARARFVAARRRR